MGYTCACFSVPRVPYLGLCIALCDHLRSACEEHVADTNNFPFVCFLPDRCLAHGITFRCSLAVEMHGHVTPPSHVGQLFCCC